MAKSICTAKASSGRINLIIQKHKKGYKQFSKVLDDIEKNGFMCWYGDVNDENDKETSGIIITSKRKKNE